MNWWQNLPENINPVFIKIGTFQIQYYGLMYLLAAATFYFLVMYRIKSEKVAYTKDMIQSFLIYAFLGVIIGGRLGYVLFYNPVHFFANPFKIINPFDFSNGFRFIGISGMSYHGGLLGVIIVTYIFCRKTKINLLKFMDFVVPVFPFGYTFGRLGNFLNGELYGRITNLPWGMYFPLDSTNQLRHPSQLYEAFFEGIILFAILWTIRNINKKSGFLFALYLAGYGFVRFIIEFFREPDSHLGYIFEVFTIGHILCLIMILTGLLILFISQKKSPIGFKMNSES